MSAERFEVLEPILRAAAPSFVEGCRRIVALAALELVGGPAVPYWVIRDAATGAAYVVTAEQAREALAVGDALASRRTDPLPLIEETSDPSELPTVSEWLAEGGTLREVTPPPEAPS